MRYYRAQQIASAELSEPVLRHVCNVTGQTLSHTGRRIGDKMEDEAKALKHEK